MLFRQAVYTDFWGLKAINICKFIKHLRYRKIAFINPISMRRKKTLPIDVINGHTVFSQIKDYEWISIFAIKLLFTYFSSLNF